MQPREHLRRALARDVGKGTPAVVADAGALPEVVGGAGVLFDPHSAEALAAALGPVLRDPGLRATLAARGRERATAYTWEASARAALAGFADLAR